MEVYSWENHLNMDTNGIFMGIACIILDEFDYDLTGKFRHWNDGQELRHHPQMALFQLPFGKRLHTMCGPQDISWFRFAPVTIVITCYKYHKS